jgi:RNA polymerase sigma factor (sigma-70 family)
MADARHDWFLKQIFQHRAALHRYVRKFMRNADDIEDLVQEAYVRVYTLPDYVAVESPRGMLFRIAHNLAIEHSRQRKAQATDCVEDFELPTVVSREPSPEEQLDARRRLQALSEALALLPPVCRRVFVLHKVHKRSHAEIANILGIAPSTIEKHVAKGMIRCRDYLRERNLLEGIEAPRRGPLRHRVRDAGEGT